MFRRSTPHTSNIQKAPLLGITNWFFPIWFFVLFWNDGDGNDNCYTFHFFLFMLPIKNEWAILRIFIWNLNNKINWQYFRQKVNIGFNFIQRNFIHSLVGNFIICGKTLFTKAKSPGIGGNLFSSFMITALVLVLIFFSLVIKFLFWSLLRPNKKTTQNKIDRKMTNTTIQMTRRVLLAWMIPEIKEWLMESKKPCHWYYDFFFSYKSTDIYYKCLSALSFHTIFPWTLFR